MRKHFSNYIENIAADKKDLVFITGDLGYNALEQVRDMLGERFINAGVAEQNMISMAAGMAYKGFQVVCYSIAPFVVYRCLEQMRNDVCFHEMPVYIVGNGGGYHYGALGSSHHALEDIAALGALPNIRCYVPAFADDMHLCMDEMFQRRGPAYLRLGIGKQVPANMVREEFGYAQTSDSPRLTIVGQSPVVNNILTALSDSGFSGQADVFVVNRMPFGALPAKIAQSIAATKRVLVVEEHVQAGGLGSALALEIAKSGLALNNFRSLCAQGYPGGLYGNQDFHRQMSGLDAVSIAGVITEMMG